MRKLWNRLRQFGVIRLLMIMVLVAMCVFVQLPYRQEVAESSMEGVVSEENTGNLGAGSRARQRFYFKKDVTLHNVDIRFDMQDGLTNTEYLTIYIRDKEMNEIAKKRVYTKDMKDGEMTRVYFKGGVEIPGRKSYYLIVTGPKLEEGEYSPAVRLASFASPNKRLYVGGSLVKNQTLDVVYNYKYDDSFNSLGMYIAGLLMIILLFVPRNIWRRIGANKGVGWALFFVNPTIVLEITLRFYELSNGRLPAMKWYTYLLLLMLQMIVYAIINNKYITLLLMNTLCFLLSVVNLQVSAFKGVPLLPSDFLFLKTAAEVSDNYTITWTHTQIHFMLFMVVYTVFVFFLGTYRKKTAMQRKEERKAKKMQKRRQKQENAETEGQDAITGAEAQVVATAGAETQVDAATGGEAQVAATTQAEAQVATAAETAESVMAEETENVKPAMIDATENAADQAERVDSTERVASQKKESRKRYWCFMARLVFRITFLLIGVHGIHYLYTTTILAQNEIAVDIWNRNKSYKKNGIYLDFFMNFHYLSTEKPEGYSQEAVQSIIDQKTTKPETNSGTNAKTGSKDPNIIIIMNESLADYTLLNNGDAMTYNKDYLPFIHSMEDNVIKGKCYVSVFGGQTANSEFECLTGNSLAFFPASSVPYQQFVNGKTFSLPIYLESLGYKTTAIHPCVGTNWNREVVYDSMNFDKFYTQNDFVNPEYVRYISDEENYNKIISQFENKKEDEKLFIMNVTMQNHGGYTDDTEWEDPIVAGDGEYILANEYLSSAHVSDQAYEYLIDYFTEYDEPTIILMFGDHHPSIDEEFIDTVLGGTQDSLTLEQMQEKYCTPYILWANYDIEANTEGVSSTNFLSNLVLENAGLPLSRYHQVIASVQEEVQAMNAFGYMTKDGSWHEYTDKTQATDLLNDYSIAEYGYFSEKDENKMAEIFELPLTDVEN